MMLVTLGSLTFPLTPEKITVESGAQVQTYKVLDLGTVSFPRGREPKKVTFDGILPGPSLQQFADFVLGPPTDPVALANQIETWVDTAADLRFYVTGAFIYFDHAYVASFSQTSSGGLGDIGFSITVVELRPIVVLTTGQTQAGAPSFQAQGLPTPPATYIPGRGENLMTISAKLYGTSSLWSLIYQANFTQMGRYDAPIVGMTLIIPGGQ